MHADKCSMPIQPVYKIFDSAMPSSILLLTFQLLGLGPNPDLGLDKSPDETKIKFFFMASLHMLLLQFIHSHTFKSSLNSANQLPKAMPVQLSSLLHYQKEARSKCQQSHILNRNTTCFQMPMKSNKVTHVSKLV